MYMHAQYFLGLARTCEIFGVSELVLSNIKVLEEKQFQSLSVTAEKWLTIKEVYFFILLCVYRMCVHSKILTLTWYYATRLCHWDGPMLPCFLSSLLSTLFFFIFFFHSLAGEASLTAWLSALHEKEGLCPGRCWTDCQQQRHCEFQLQIEHRTRLGVRKSIFFTPLSFWLPHIPSNC